MKMKERIAHVKLYSLYISTLNGFSRENIEELKKILELVEK